MNAQPKCPECKVEGVEHIVSTESNSKSGGGDAWFDIAHCDECGHVYGVFNKVSNPPSRFKNND